MMKKLLILCSLFTFTFFQLSAQIFTLPYFDDFETGAPGWISDSTNGTPWELGMPAFGATTGTYSGNNCWDTNLDSNYHNASNSFLSTPTFNFGNASAVKISFWQNRNVEASWDGFLIMYNTMPAGPVWNILGTIGAAGSINWYNTAALISSGLPAWTGTSGGWINSSIILPNIFGNADVQFRFRFTSDNSVSSDGLSIDDFRIEPAAINGISGTVFLDLNNDFILDPGDLPYPLATISSTSTTGTEIQPASNSGTYYFVVDSGITYVISPIAPLYSVSTPTNYSIAFSGSNQVNAANDFLITFESNVVDVGVHVTQTGVRPGFNHTCHLNYYNHGTTITSGTIELTYDSNYTFISASQVPAGAGTNTIEFTYTNLLPGQSASISCQFLADSTLAIGSATYVSGIIYPIVGDTLPSNNVDSIRSITVNSVDPNDKAVVPDGDILLQQVMNGMNLNYTIRFQNTGTAPAIHVNIYDELSAYLDLNTFEIVASSHPINSWNISSNRLLHFSFANIMLPDSVSDEPNSHGYVKFKIKPLTTAALGSFITNEAAIYFDNNLPVITNTTQNEIVIPTGVATISTHDHIVVYPNPNSGSFGFAVPQNSQSFKLINTLGQTLAGGVINTTNGIQQVNIKNNSPGVYILTITGENFNNTTRVIIK